MAGEGSEDAGGDLVVARDVLLPAGDLRWRFSRSSGPGGQGVNTTDSRVELSVDLTSAGAMSDDRRARLLDRLAARLHDGVVTVVASDDRSQLRNRRSARARLAALLRDALAPDPPPRVARKPSRRAKARRVEAKRRQSDVKKMRRRPDTE